MSISLEKMGNFSPVAEYCLQEKIQLHASVTHAARSGKAAGECQSHTPSHAAFAAGAQILSHGHPDVVLSTGLIEPEIAPDDATLHLITLLNSDFTYGSTGAWDTTFACEDVGMVDTCSSAELAFASTLHSIPDGCPWDFKEQIAAKNKGFQVYVGEGNRPIFLRKSDGEKSTLVLEDIGVNGRLFSAGSIARIEAADNLVHAPYPEYAYPHVSTSEVQVLPVETVGKVAVMRLSAFASPPDERIQFLTQYEDVAVQTRQKVLREATMLSIRTQLRRLIKGLATTDDIQTRQKF